jgi:hypothetical protein
VNLFQSHLCDTGLNHIELPRRGQRQVNNPVADEWPAIVDPDQYRPTIGQVRNPDDVAKRKRTMRGCEFVQVEDFPARSFAALVPFAIIGGNAGLHEKSGWRNPG